MRDRLIELIEQGQRDYYNAYGSNGTRLNKHLADYLLKNGVVVPPFVAYNKKHERYQTVHVGKQGHIFASKLYRTRKEAEQKLQEMSK